MPRASGRTLRITIGSSAGMRSRTVSARREPAARPAARRGGNSVRRVPGRRAHAAAPDEARTTRRGSTPTTRGSRVGLLDPLEQQLGGEARPFGRAEVDGRQRRPGDLAERAVVHADERHVARNVEAAPRAAPRARRRRGGRSRRGSRRAASARAGVSAAARPGSVMKSAATSISASSRTSPHERRPSR